MGLVLCLETATTVCSVALAKDGKMIALREVNQGYTHSENLTIFTEQVLAEGGFSFSQLDAIAVSKGPGSYTGLRIGVSAAKGFCFALDKPLISVNTLRAMAFGVGITVDLTLALSKGEGISMSGGSKGEGRSKIDDSTIKGMNKIEESTEKRMNKIDDFTEKGMNKIDDSTEEGMNKINDSKEERMDMIDSVMEDAPKYHTAGSLDYHKLLERAKRNRKDPTFAEKIIWHQLRNRATGFKFRRQHPVDKFIPDFVCIEKKLIVEVDGITHKGREKGDRSRAQKFEALGFMVMRFTDEEVVGELDRVIAAIKEVLGSRPSDEESINQVKEREEPYGHGLQGKQGTESLRSFEKNNTQKPLSLGESNTQNPLSFGEGNTPPPLSFGENNTQDPLSFGEGRGEVNRILLCPMIDARRMEVYCAFYDLDNNEVRPTSAEIITEDSFSDILRDHRVIFFGDGASKCRQALTHPNAVFIENAFPSAEFLVQIAENKFSSSEFEDVAYFEPYYLKDFVSGGQKKG